MEPLIIKPTNRTPKVELDPANGKFEISGRSFPENLFEFYNPVLDWLQEYANNPHPKTKLSVRFIYYNSASYKIFLKVLKILLGIYTDGNEVTVYWYYEKRDIELLNAGKYYAKIIKIPFEFVSY